MNPPKILCVTPNPAVDRTMVVPTVTAGEIHRSYEIVVDAGGKGLNVARAVQNLGGKAVCAGFLGGLSGQRVETLAEAEGFASAWTQIEGETRTCVIVRAQDGSESTVFNENGPTVSADEWMQFGTDLPAAAAACDLVCLSGSLPAGVDPEALSALIRTVEASGTAVWVDTSGAALRAAVAGRPSMIKVNQHEAGEIAGLTIDSPADAVTAAESFREKGVRSVAISLGSAGGVLVTSHGAWWAQPPSLAVQNSVASGDSFMAGLAVATVRDCEPDVALCYAVAAGTANATSTGGAHFTKETVEHLLGQIVLESVGG